MTDHFTPSCFRPSKTTSGEFSPGTPKSSGSSNLTTSLYHTSHGLFNLTWSRSLLSRTLHLHFENCKTDASSPTLFFHLQIKPFIFSKKHGSKKMYLNSQPIQINWDFRKSRFGSRPEPESGFYLAVIVSGEMTFLAGDLTKEAYAKTRSKNRKRLTQTLLQRREHVMGNKVYKTRTEFGGRIRVITIESHIDNDFDDMKLFFSIDEKMVLQVKHLKWKFRGNERIEVDGVHVHVSWDVYSWLFDDNISSNGSGHALFMFRFEKPWFNEEFETEADTETRLTSSEHDNDKLKKKCESKVGFCGFGINGFEKRKVNNKRGDFLKTSKSSFSSSSISSTTSSGRNSSVLEWASMEEKELESTSGFSLLVYAWKS